MKKLPQILCLCSVLFLTSCDYIIPSTWNYRITVEIETPEGIKTGSAVRQVRAWKNVAQWLNPDVRRISYDVIGEAVVVDLEERGVVFALIDWDSYKEMFSAFPISANTWKERLMYFNNLEVGTKAELNQDLPRFVTFDNFDDSMSIRGVDRNKMNEIFDKGVSFKSVSVEITDDSVAFGEVDNWLPPSFSSVVIDGWHQLKQKDKHRMYGLVKFKRGSK